MSHLPFEYRLAQRNRIAEIKHALNQAFPLQEQPVKQFVRCYYDTDDWRLYYENYHLISESGPDHIRLFLQSRKNAHVGRVIRVNAMPLSASEFPVLWQKQMLSLLSTKVLLPQLCLQCRVITLDYRNEQDKLYLQLLIENNRVQLDTGVYRQAGKRLRLMPLKGYGEIAQRIAKSIQQKWQLQPEAESEMEFGLRLLQRLPRQSMGTQTTRPVSQTPAQTALCNQMLQLLDEMESHETGLHDKVDAERLHDFRVAVRRTRSILGQFKRVFDKQRLRRFHNDFDWLGEVTGPTRDLQVYLMKFTGYTQVLPATLRPHLSELKTFLSKQLEQEIIDLHRHLASQHYRQLKNGWRDFLLTLSDATPETPSAAQPIKEVANKRIWKMFRRVLDHGANITSASPVEKLHRLRIDCKTLRYLLEFSRDFYPPKRLQRNITTLKKLQDNLGAINDLHMQIISLQHYQEQMFQAQLLNAQTQTALEHLIAHLHDLQLSQRLLFNDRFAEFNTAQHRRQFESLFKPNLSKPQQSKASAC